MKLYTGGYLAFYLPHHQQKWQIALKQPTPLQEILAQLGLPLGEVYLAAINGEWVDLDTAIAQETDDVRVFSAVDGG